MRMLTHIRNGRPLSFLRSSFPHRTGGAKKTTTKKKTSLFFSYSSSRRVSRNAYDDLITAWSIKLKKIHVVSSESFYAIPNRSKPNA